MLEIISKSQQETIGFGKKLASLLTPGAVIAFIGDLATGKTTMIKGIAQQLGIERDVESPTYTLINEYDGNIKVYHMDCYREVHIQEWIEIGLEDYFYGDGICLIEWADRIDEILPEDVIKIRLLHDMRHGNTRKIIIESDQATEQKFSTLLDLN